MSNLTDSRLQELAAVADGRAVLYGYENHHEATPDTQLSKARDTAAAIRELLGLRQRQATRRSFGTCGTTLPPSTTSSTRPSSKWLGWRMTQRKA